MASPVHEGFTEVKSKGGITKFKLDNNWLSILLMEEQSAPVITFMIICRVDSRNEVTGTTRATHILEHLMFKGTDKFNKENDLKMKD